MLDFRTIVNFTLTCEHAITVVRSLPAYRDLMKYAAEPLGVLAMTGLLRCYSAGTIYTALLSKKCVSCGEFGPFLFLPTCERCCSNCLHANPSLRVITPQVAKRVFGITPAQLKWLPVMWSIPGEYFMERDGVFGCLYRPGFEEEWERRLTSRKQSVRLVSVKACKQLAMEKIPEDQLRNDFQKHRDWGDLAAQRSTGC